MPLAASVAKDLLRHALPDFEASSRSLPFTLPQVNEALPDGGLARGGIIEIASPRGLGCSTTLALSACAAAQAEARLRAGNATAGAWCGWIDPTASLFAPAVVRAGIDLNRLLVARPTPDSLAKVAVRMAQSHVFSVLVIDTVGIAGAFGQSAAKDRTRTPAWQGEDLGRWVNVVRKLALSIEGSDGIILLLTDKHAARPMPLPVAMRIELERAAEDRLMISVAKDRRGKVTSPTPVMLPKKPAQVHPLLKTA